MSPKGIALVLIVGLALACTPPPKPVDTCDLICGDGFKCGFDQGFSLP